MVSMEACCVVSILVPNEGVTEGYLLIFCLFGLVKTGFKRHPTIILESMQKKGKKMIQNVFKMEPGWIKTNIGNIETVFCP